MYVCAYVVIRSSFVRWLNGRKEVVRTRYNRMMIALSRKKCDYGTGGTLLSRRSEIYLISLMGKEQPKQQRSSITVLYCNDY